jgi:hypothetical protein
MSPQHSCRGAVPTRLRLALHKNIGGNAISKSQKVACDIDLNNESGEAPEWLEHPAHKFKVDLAVIKIPNDEKFRASVTCHYLAEYKDFQGDFLPSVMNDVFVIGYPWGLTGGDLALPLYKRGSIASEPIVDHGNLPRFLIDCRTANAMSGSPVICSHSGIWAPGGFSNSSILGTVENFAGVYSGRLIANELDEDKKDADRVSEIGIVWKKKALDEIIDSGVAGSKLSEL